MKKVTCPNCDNYGSAPTMEESARIFSLEKSGDTEGAKRISAFRERGQVRGRPFWVCNECDAGLWIKFFGKPILIVGSDLEPMKNDWETRTGTPF